MIKFSETRIHIFLIQNLRYKFCNVLSSEKNMFLRRRLMNEFNIENLYFCNHKMRLCEYIIDTK